MQTACSRLSVEAGLSGQINELIFQPDRGLSWVQTCFQCMDALIYWWWTVFPYLWRSDDVIVHLKSMFSGHGIPEILFSDNGPQFSRQMFASVAADYGFSHITSSPRFVQSNGEAECQVQMVKHLLSKAKDPYLAMLAHRTTPLANPAQLLMGRRLHTPIPQHHSLLIRCSSKEKGMRKKQAASYNTRHCTRQLSHLTSGQRV